MDRDALLKMLSGLPTPPPASGQLRALPAEQRRGMLTAFGKMLRVSLEGSPVFGTITDEDIDTVVAAIRNQP